MNKINAPWVESPFFNEEIKEKNISEEDKRLAEEYNENGFIVLKGLFTNELLDAVKSDMDNKGFNTSFEFKNQRDHVRVQDLWEYSDSVKQLACNEKVLRVLEMLYEREPVPFQTLNFKVGTQQRAHSDTIHFSSLPARFMCGVWVALEDITPDNGAVFYYPGSHRTPEYSFAHFKPEPRDASYADYIDYEDFIEKITLTNGWEKKPFYAKKGDALIWSSNIIHGGSKVLKEGVTRYSQVTHYYFKDCIYYTPMLSNMVTNELFLRKDLKDIKTGKKVVTSFNGYPLKTIETEKNRSILNNRLNSLSKLFRFIRKSR